VAPLSKGKVPENLPLMSGHFRRPFIRGVVPPSMRDKFVVIYPDYVFSLGGRRILVTHGHYLDEKQTLFKNLDDLIRREKGNEARAVRKFFIGTAQYQAVANAVSYLKGTRDFVDKVHKTLSGLFDAVSKLRHQPIDAEMLEAIELYLLYMRKGRPDIFIFGHTHEAAHTFTDAFQRTARKRRIRKVIEVWNDGCFVEKKRKKLAGSCLLAETDPSAGYLIRCFEVGPRGRIMEKPL